jgi:hypothetical protein
MALPLYLVDTHTSYPPESGHLVIQRFGDFGSRSPHRRVAKLTDPDDVTEIRQDGFLQFDALRTTKGGFL